VEVEARPGEQERQPRDGGHEQRQRSD
jgi:hypothetical protein